MRAAVVVVVCEAVLLVSLAFAQFQIGAALSRTDAGQTLDVPADPLISTLGQIEVGLWLAAPLLVGLLVARTGGRKSHAAGLAFAGAAAAAVAAPLFEQFAASSFLLLDSGQGPRGLYVFVPPGGWTPDSAFLPLLIPIAIVIGGGVPALEAALAAGMARRLGG